MLSRSSVFPSKSVAPLFLLVLFALLCGGQDTGHCPRKGGGGLCGDVDNEIGDGDSEENDNKIQLEEVEDDWIGRDKLVFIESSGEKQTGLIFLSIG